ncbi:MAG: hypothetical protein Q9167_004556, partial [Letrouitia subvulpina]
MEFSNHPQPALLYLVPTVVGALWITALLRGEVRKLWVYSEAKQDNGKPLLAVQKVSGFTPKSEDKEQEAPKDEDGKIQADDKEEEEEEEAKQSEAESQPNIPDDTPLQGEVVSFSIILLPLPWDTEDWVLSRKQSLRGKDGSDVGVGEENGSLEDLEEVGEEELKRLVKKRKGSDEEGGAVK